MAKGKVYLVGAGPARPDLITVRGLNILKEANVIIYDYLVDRRLLAEVGEKTELICADELGKKRYADTFAEAQKEINRLMVKRALQGKRVIRLKNGDPSIFGRLSQEVEALIKNGINFEIVPGVTAASAAAAYTGVPLTDRGFASSAVFVTGHEDPGKSKSLLDWESIVSQGTIVLYMAVENLSGIARKLIAFGKPQATQVLVVSDAGNLTQKVARGNLGNIIYKTKEAGIKPPAIIIVGAVVGLEKEYDWFLKSKRVLFTGLSEERFFEDKIFFHLPLIKIEPLNDYRQFDAELKRIEDYDWIVFSSRFGVEYFFQRLRAAGLDARKLSGAEIAAIGRSTANRLRDFGILADLIPRQESSEGLLKEFQEIDLCGGRVFLPRSDLADKGLTKGLEKIGAKVTSVVAYRNVIPKDLPDLDLKFFDEIYFTSPSTVRNFKKRYGRVPKGIGIRWIGKVTKQELVRQRLI